MSRFAEDLLTGCSQTYASYSPGELAQISGLSTDMQRVWRKRGQLASLPSGHARFRPMEVIEISIRYALSKLGVAIADVPPMGSLPINAAIYHALLNSDGACELIGPAPDVNSFLDEFEKDHGLAFALAGKPPSSNYLIWDDEDRVRVLDDPQHVFDGMGASIIAIDLQVIGRRLVERGRKAIMTVEFPTTAGARQVRRLTGVGANDS
jgi:hypothetical protein